MSKCDRCGKQVTRYLILEGRDICYLCHPIEVRNLQGFRFNGSPVPTMTDHAKNLGTPRPSRGTQESEYREMSLTASCGGTRGQRTNIPAYAQRMANRVQERYAKAR